jgi:hypothetical protein
MASACFGIEALTDRREAKHSNVFRQGCVYLCSDFFELSLIVECTLLLVFARWHHQLGGEDVQKSVDSFVSTGRTAEANLFEVSIVEVVDETQLMQRVFQLAFDGPHVLVLLRATEVVTVVASHHHHTGFL